ncbi:MAG: metallophosphoesterase family protein [Phycisphaeraceae bacterium]|nr:metallophosphoesterase family protein [Phycisphaeraceae bacterium]
MTTTGKTTAIISDVHGNAPALKAVIADIKNRAIDRMVCLGDIIGYGPDPLECVDLVRRHAEWSLMGNHDFAVLYEPTNFNPGAETAAYWTRAQFDAEADEAKRRERYEFLGRLPVRVVEKTAEGLPVLAVHGSPRRPINEYIFKEDVVNAPDKVTTILDRVQRLCVVGHTHVPGVFTDEPDFYPPNELTENTYRFIDEKAIVNVGSVGQPRDGDPRACYAILHPDRIEFVRVPYDIDAIANKIKAIPELSDYLGDRLYEGK